MTNKLTRRDFLRASAIGVGGVLASSLVSKVAAQGPMVKPRAQTMTVSVMYPDGEFPQEYRDYVKSEFGIDIEFLQEDLNRLAAMWAAGEPPDIWRANALQVGPHSVNKQLLPLSDYVNASSVIKWDDFQPAYKQHMFDGVKRGEGTLFGIPKDWGTDFLVYCLTSAFEEAGVEVPSDTEPISFEKFFELSAKLTKREGDRTLRWGGASHYWEAQGVNAPSPQFFLEVLPQIAGAQPLYNDDFSKISLADNPGVKEVFMKWYESATAFATPSSLDPMPSWFGQVFTQGTLAMAQAGYWFGAMAESDVTKGQVKVIPAPYWGDPAKRTNSSVWATATVGSSKAANPDAVWKIIEYYSAGKPAEDRAVTGWGVPILKSMFALLPQDTDYNKQRYTVLEAELKFADRALAYNPYVDGMTEAASIVQQALEGNITPEQALLDIETATNETIQDTIDRM